MQTRSPSARPEWEDAVYSTLKNLPGGHKVTGHKAIVVLLRWAYYASWSNGRHGENGFVSVETLASDVNVDERTVRRALDVAIGLGLLKKTSGPVGFDIRRPASYAAMIPTDYAGPVGVRRESTHTGPAEVRNATRQTGPPGVRHDEHMPDPVTPHTGPGDPARRTPGGPPTPDPVDPTGRAVADVRQEDVDAVLAVINRQRELIVSDRPHLTALIKPKLQGGWTADALGRELRDLRGNSPIAIAISKLQKLPDKPPTDFERNVVERRCDAEDPKDHENAPMRADGYCAWCYSERRAAGVPA